MSKRRQIKLETICMDKHQGRQNKNSPVLTEVSQGCHQFIIDDLLADLNVCQHQSPCCVANCCYSVVTFSHPPGARGQEACELR